MTVNDMVQRVSRSWRSHEWKLRKAVGREEITKAAAGALHLGLGFAFSCAGIFGGYKPFGAALTAAAGGSINGLLVLIGVMLGHISFDPFDWAMKYMGISVLIFSTSAILKDTEFVKYRWFPMIVAATFTGGIGFIYISDNWTYSNVMLETVEVVLCAATSTIFSTAFLTKEEKKHISENALSVSAITMLAVMCIALEEVTVFGIISIGRTLVVLFLMLAALKCGGIIGCALGFGLGLAMDAGTGLDIYFSAAMGAAGFVCGTIGKRGRLACASGFVLPCTVFVLWLNKSAAILYEGFIAGVIFLVMPEYIAARVRTMFPLQVSGCGAIKAREYTKNRVEQMALAFSELYNSVQITTNTEAKSETAGIFDKAADSVCRLCPDMERCWERDAERTLGVMEAVTPRMFSKGSLTASDFPVSFAESCPYLRELTAAINQEIRMMLYRRQYSSKLQEKRGAVYNQYADISAVLKSLAGELGSELTFEPELEQKLKRYLAGLNIEANAAVFRDCGGRLRAEIYGDSVAALRQERDYLEKLSAVLGTRLCTGGRTRQDNRMLLLEAEPLAVSVGIAALKKKGQPVSGDRGTYFKTDDGVLNILLSDGMGTGTDAAVCSESAIRILERFLRAGIPPETSMRILNDLMLLKNDTETVCATVDLMCVDMFSGEARLYKFGAAPSYIRKGTIVKRLASRSLSVGLGCTAGESPDYVKMKLESDTFAVIISDGIAAGDDDGWLRALIAGYEGRSAKELAREILAIAKSRSGCEDDMTVLVLYMEDRP